MHRSILLLALCSVALGVGGGCSDSSRPAGPANPAPAAGAGGGAAPAGGNPAVSRENFRRVQRGMTRPQVEQVFGPGASVPRTDIHRAIRSTGPPGRTDTTVLKWQNGRDTLFLELTQRGVAAGWYVTEKEDGAVAYDLLGS